jgi:hypothetical protein
VNSRGLDRPRVAWLDRFIVPRETPLAPSRWHPHVVQRRISRYDHLRPHRLNWEALTHPEALAAEGDDVLTPRRMAGIRWSSLEGVFTRPQAVALYQTVVFASAVVGPLLGDWLADTYGFHVIFGASGAGRLLGILLYVWLAARLALGPRGARAATPAADAA